MRQVRLVMCSVLMVCATLFTSCDDPLSYQGYKAPDYVPAIIPQYVTVDIRVAEQLTDAPSTRTERKWQFAFSDAELAADTANGESLISLLLHLEDSEAAENISSYVSLKNLQFEMQRLAVFEHSSLIANSPQNEQSPVISMELQERWPVTEGPVVSYQNEVELQLKHHTPATVEKGTEAPDHLAMSFEIPHSHVLGSNPALTYTVTGVIRLYY